jgi:hypothetical protein
VLCEAAGMGPMLSNVADDYRVGTVASSGFNSLTAKYELYTDALERWEEDDQDSILLHLGDHDPSGVAVYESLDEDLTQFALDQGYDPFIEVRRVALTPELIAQLISRSRIETTPDEVKPSDSRSRSFIARGLEPAAQLEAIPPDTLTTLVRQAIEDALDMDQLRASVQREREESKIVQKKLDEVNEVLREAFGLEDEEG